MISIVVSMAQSVQTNLVDPLLINASMAFSRNYYPVGFFLQLATNSPDVVAAADECWGELKLEFVRDPIEIRVIVQPVGKLSPKPSFRCQRHLYSVIGDAENFAVADLQRLFAFLVVSAKTAADHSWLRWFFLESLAYTLLEQRYLVPVHAACVARNGSGILLCGPSGAGKSTLAFACAREGWVLVSDDCTWLLPDAQDRVAIGQPREVRFRPDVAQLFPELAHFVERTRPNGKISVAVPVRDFPQIATASRCPTRCLAFLDRKADTVPDIQELAADEALRLLFDGFPTLGAEVDERYERTFRRLTELPAFRLQYAALQDGLQLVERLNDETSV